MNAIGPVTVTELVRAIVARGGHASLRNAPGSMTAARLCGERSELRPGELVTLLAPIAEAVAAAHELGWSHGGVSLDAIRLDAHGMPILGSWESAQRLEDSAGPPGPHESAPPRESGPRKSGSQRTSVATMRAPRRLWGRRRQGRRRKDGGRTGDVSAVTDIVRSLAPSNGPATAELERLLRAVAATDPCDRAGALVDSLYEWSIPEAVDTGQSPADASAGRDGDRHDGAANARKGRRAASMPSRRRREVENGSPAGNSAAGRVPRAVRRRPLVVSCGVVCALAAVGVVGLETIWSGSAATEPASGLSPASGETAAGEAPVASGSTSAETAEGIAGPESPAEGTTAEGEPLLAGSAPWPAEGAPRTGADEPFRAATELVGSRNECLSRREPSCLDRLFAPDAPGIEVDLAVIEHPAAPALVEVDTCSLTDLNGDIALVQCLDDAAGPVAVTIELAGEKWYLREVRAGKPDS